MAKKPSASEESANLRREFAVAMAEIPNDWLKLNEMMGSSRFTYVAVVSNPEEAEEWKFLRPPNVQASMLDQLSDDLIDTNVWIPDAAEGFVSAVMIKRGEKTSEVHRNKKKMPVQSELVLDANPSIFDGCEDMSLMTNLNEATVLHNLRMRFRQNLIHTYSGLFCITINPWRWLPIYSPKIVFLYRGQPLNTMPPHIYSIADGVYSRMVEGRRNQSILITGESGSGKTENTKKLVQFFTVVAGKRTVKGVSSLEDQIVESNPILEAFGNAKNGINDNSSRFGKFIKIFFTGQGKVSKAEVESYLLEKSRVVSQYKDERGFHIFYELLAAKKELKDLLHLRGGPKDYKFLQNGMTSIDGVDDGVEMELTEHALNTLGFSAAEQTNLLKMTAACLIMGEIRFRAQSRLNDQAMVEHFGAPDDVCDLLGIESMAFIESMTQPMVFVNGEWVKQARGIVQVNASVQSVAKSVYEKAFRWLVKRCNASLGSKAPKKKAREVENFIGILDIAGFEIFQLNSFEQLCINYTNERLQQFFNHTMFVQEQEEYQAEGLEWDYMNFAMDLKPAIDLIDQPMGILSILEEECIAPQASDDRFAHKLLARHEGKTEKFGKPAVKYVKGSTTKAIAHFSVVHYAGSVNYNVDGWIEKCKDPLNPAVVKLFQAAKNDVLREIWTAHAGVAVAPKSKDENGTKPRVRRQSMAFMTVSGLYREQLANLLRTLNQTTPHFVRCIVPNYERRPGYLNAPLVMNQLRCNGVLEGIRICRKGYPNRLRYEEVKERYGILAPGVADLTCDPKVATTAICTAANLKNDQDYQLGLTKIFFKVGILARLEKLRTQILGDLMLALQTNIRWYLANLQMQRIKQIIEPTILIQRNVRKWIKMRQWPWFKLMKSVGPLAKESIHAVKLKSEAVEQEKQQLSTELEAMRNMQQNIESKYATALTDHVDKIKKTKDDMEKAKKRIIELEGDVTSMTDKLNEKDAQIEELQKENDELRSSLEKIAQSKKETRSVGVEATIITEKDIDDLTNKIEQQDAKFLELEKVFQEREASHKDNLKKQALVDDFISRIVNHTRKTEDILKSDVSCSGTYDAALKKSEREMEKLNTTTEEIIAASDLIGRDVCVSLVVQAKSLATAVNEKITELHSMHENLSTCNEYIELLEAKKLQSDALANELAARLERLSADLIAQMKVNEQLIQTKHKIVDVMTARLSELQEKLNLVESVLNTKARKRGSVFELPKFTPEEPKSPDDQSKRIDELTELAKQLIDKAIDRHNQLETILIRIAAAEKANEKLQAMLESRDLKLASCELEIANLKESLNEERNSRNEMHKEIDEFRARIKRLEEKVLQHDNEMQLKERKLADLDNQLNQSRKEQQKLTEKMNKYQQRLRDIVFNFDKIQKNLEGTQLEFRQLEAQHRILQDDYEKLIGIIRELKVRIVELEEELNTERSVRKLAEKAMHTMSDEIAARIEELRETELRLEQQIETTKQKDAELQRKQEELDLLRVDHEREIMELKDRHATSVKLYQDKLDEQHKKTIKLESENQKIKAQLYNDNVESETEGRRQTRMNAVQFAKLSDEYQLNSLPRKFASGIGMAARQMDDLEKEKQDLLTEKRLMKREMDVYEKMIQDEYEKNELLAKTNRQLKTENALLIHEAKTKLAVNTELTKKIRQLETHLAQHKETMSKLLEHETEVDADRYRHHSLTRTESYDSKSSSFSSLERRRNDFERSSRPSLYKRMRESFDE